MTPPPDTADLATLAWIVLASLAAVVVAIVALARTRAVPPPVGASRRDHLLARDARR